VFLTEALASHGWIVAAPDHHDRHSGVRIRTGQVKDYDRRGLLKHARQIAASGREDRGEYMYRMDESKLEVVVKAEKAGEELKLVSIENQK